MTAPSESLLDTPVENGFSDDASGASPAPIEGLYTSPNFHKYSSGNALYQWHLRQVMTELYEMLAATTPQTVLDAGCGEGFVTRFLREQEPSWKLTGVDLSEKAVGYARRHANGHANGESNGEARYAVGDLYDLPFEDGAFDTVLCSEVLEHLVHPDRAFEELRRVAREWVVVSVPREPYFQWLNDLGQMLSLSPDPGHVNFWSEQDFRHFVRGHVQHPRFATKHVYQLARGRAA